MKKKKIIRGAQILLLLIAAYIFFAKNDMFFNDNNDIALSKTEAVNRFVIESDTSNITIEKKEGQWTVNKVYAADNKMVDKLFRLFKNIEISTFPAKDSLKFCRHRLKNEANRILFFQSEKLLAKYWVAKYNLSKKSTLLMKNSQNPVYAKALGLTPDIAQYVVTEELLWRNKQIFAFDSDKIKLLEFKHKKDSSLSFCILKEKKEGYIIKNINRQKIKANLNKIARYLSYFGNIEFKTIANGLNISKIDSLRKQNTLYTINFEIQDYGKYSINLIEKPLASNNSQMDINYVYGLVNNKPPLLNISYFDIDPIIKEISYFKE